MAEPFDTAGIQGAVLRAEILTVKSRAESARAYGVLAQVMVGCGLFSFLGLMVYVVLASHPFNAGCAFSGAIVAALFTVAGFLEALRVRTLTSTRFDAANAQALLKKLDAPAG